jgi:electron transfer flavoprotein beta subunit
MRPPTIIVCIKSVPDPEGPASSFEVDGVAKKIAPVGIPPVINPFDENALEVGARLKDRWGGRMIVMNVSGKATTAVLKKALSVGADELILAEDSLFDGLTSPSTALVLSSMVRKIGSYDLILTGRQAADWDSGQTGLLLAEILGIPAINLARAVELQGGSVAVEKLKRVGYEVVTAPLPALVTVSSEAGELRWPSVKAMQEVRKKPVTTWRHGDLNVEAGVLKTRSLRSLSYPPSRSRDCVFIDGNSPEEKGGNLAVRLVEDGVV